MFSTDSSIIYKMNWKTWTRLWVLPHQSTWTFSFEERKITGSWWRLTFTFMFFSCFCFFFCLFTFLLCLCTWTWFTGMFLFQKKNGFQSCRIVIAKVIRWSKVSFLALAVLFFLSFFSFFSLFFLSFHCFKREKYIHTLYICISFLSVCFTALLLFLKII